MYLKRGGFIVIFIILLITLVYAVPIVNIASDVTNPTYSTNSTNSTMAGQATLFSLLLDDDTGLSGYIFSTNNSGAWVNDSWASLNYTVNGTSGWSYRRNHTILSVADAGVNYTVQIIVVNGSGTDSGNVMYTTNIESDFGDVRFANSSGSFLDYWIEEVNSGVNATFWVELDANLSATNQIIYVYYGKTSATNISNGENTFVFFDDFNDGSIDATKWNAVSGATTTVSESTGSGRITSSSSGVWNTGSFRTQDSFSQGHAIRTRQYISQTSGNILAYNGFFDPDLAAYIGGGVTESIYSQIYRYSWVGGGAPYQFFYSTNNSVSHSETITNPRDSWKVFEYQWASDTVEHLYDNVSESLTTNITLIPDVSLEPGFSIDSGSGANGYTYSDWFVVRKYSNPEPLHDVWGSEEIQGWANVTKVLNSTVGMSVSWCVYVNDTSNNWNLSSCSSPFTLVTISNNPTVTLISPVNNTGQGQNMTFNFNVADTTNIDNCSFILNNVVNQTDLSINKSIVQNFTLNNTGVGSFNWGVNCTDDGNNIGSSEIRFFSVVKKNYFVGNTTDLTIVNIENITNLVIDSPGSGMINYTQSIDLSSGADINEDVNISQNWIEINSSALSVLNNSARLKIYNLTFNDPQILRDGELCDSIICTEESYTDNILTFTVTSFSSYSARETPSSSSSPAEGSGSSGSTGGSISVIEDVVECENNSQCPLDESCYFNECVKLFDVKILEYISPVQLNEFFNFTYYIKGMANFSGDVVIEFWIEGEEIVSSGIDTIYLGSFEDKTESTKIFIPRDLETGDYDFYVKVSFENYEAISKRSIYIEQTDEETVVRVLDVPEEKEYFYSWYWIFIVFALLFVLIGLYIKHYGVKLGLLDRLKKKKKKKKKRKLTKKERGRLLIKGLLRAVLSKKLDNFKNKK